MCAPCIESRSQRAEKSLAAKEQSGRILVRRHRRVLLVASAADYDLADLSEQHHKVLFSLPARCVCRDSRWDVT